jgi:hypothetical protein
MEKVLNHPCKTIVKAQDKGHWLITDAIYKMVTMYVEAKHEITRLETQAGAARQLPPDLMDGDDEFNIDLDALSLTMQSTIRDHMAPFLAPLKQYDPDRAHAVLAILLDPRHRQV